MFNKIIAMGKLARDPEIKEIKEGVTVGKFTLLTETKLKKRDGESYNELCYLDGVVWGQHEELIGKVEGDVILVEGRMKTESWQDKNTGEKKRKYLIHVDKIMPMIPQESNYDQKPLNEQKQKNNFPKNDAAKTPVWDDSLPF